MRANPARTRVPGRVRAGKFYLKKDPGRAGPADFFLQNPDFLISARVTLILAEIKLAESYQVFIKTWDLQFRKLMW